MGGNLCHKVNNNSFVCYSVGDLCRTFCRPRCVVLCCVCAYDTWIDHVSSLAISHAPNSVVSHFCLLLINAPQGFNGLDKISVVLCLFRYARFAARDR
jgi:hypothetical protein